MNTNSYANIPSENPTPLSKGKSATPISMMLVFKHVFVEK